MSLRRTFPAALAAAALLRGAAAAAEEPTLSVGANRLQIYLGESVVLTVKVGGDEQAQPDLSALQNCRVRFLGSQSDSRFSITIVNGQMQRERFVGRIYTYELTPTAVGAFQAGPVTVTVGGRQLRDEGPRITVTGVEEQTRVLVSVTASKETVLADESFDITLAVALERLKGRFSDLDPLDPAAPPQLSADYLQGEPLPGLDCPPVREMLQKRLLPQQDAAGFTINSYTIRRDPFSSMFNFNFNPDDFFKETPARFALDRRPLEKDGKSYFEYRLTLTYTAREEGNYTFGPAVFKGKAVLAVDGAGRAVGRNIFAVGPACTVRVVPPPEEGRPASFIGAIGTNLIAKAALNAATCNVGDPLTLTLTVSGNITLDNLRPPALGEQPALTRDFKVYDDAVKVNRLERAREFSYTIRPTREGTLEVPPLDVSYYDSEARAYRTVRTDPIPLRANRAPELESEMILNAATGRSARAGQTLQLSSRVVAPIEVDPRGAERQALVSARRHGALAALGPAVLAATVGLRTLGRAVARRARGRRRREALRRARRRLLACRAERDPAAARAALCQAIRGYLADRFDAPSAALTPADARRLLEARGVAPDLREELCAILERHFNAGYAPGLNLETRPAADGETARRLLERLEGELAERPAAETGAPAS